MEEALRFIVLYYGRKLVFHRYEGRLPHPMIEVSKPARDKLGLSYGVTYLFPYSRDTHILAFVCGKHNWWKK